MFKPSPDYNYLLKFLIVGSKGSGKSSLILRYSDDCYTDSPIFSLGVDYKIRTIDVYNKIIKTQLWDSKAEVVIENAHRYFRGAHIIMQLVDLTQSDEQIIKDIIDWNRLIDRHESKTNRIIVGTKADATGKNLTELNKRLQNILEKADCSNLICDVVSAKTDQNVVSIFTKAAQAFLLPQLGITSKIGETSKSDNRKDVKLMSREELEAEVERLSQQKEAAGCTIV